ncbi:exonuclease III [Allocatelliglobosispora scoriae]|uniref:Exonuclease III n=1 Tax=Allocatelliglobosispora scoriae TaxID=643052 RepID=A0A841BHP7_9ACTN|nr:endonuclease/exonuclease/phosphatase family protein [Allocatelliglobosispora scoriae]MBB5866709.1 exonuclease III [Allocatelliglobosispora scoriae]
MQITTLNIQAAGLARAQQLLGWLDQRDDDVVILTETSHGPGTAHLLTQCRAAGWSVVASPHAGDRGCAIVSRHPLVPAEDITTGISPRCRAAACRLDTEPAIAVLGVYVPSNDRSPAKAEKKRSFLDSVLRAVYRLPTTDRQALIIGGDYNLITRDHQPPYPGVFTNDDYAFLDAIACQRFGKVEQS